MILLHYICIISLIGTVFGHGKCGDMYTETKSESLCLTTPMVQKLDEHAQVCERLRPPGVPFIRRMSDPTFDDFKQVILVLYQGGVTESFIGMKKGSGYGNKKWQFNKGGTVVEGDYPFWATDPQQGEDCAVLSKQRDYKVQPQDCNYPTKMGICEKNGKPCYHDRMSYVEYYGRCLSQSQQEGTYQHFEDGALCTEGYAAPLKDAEDMKIISQALLTGHKLVYSGLKRNSDGKWFYDSGEEETERLNPDSPGEEECGIWAVDKDGEITMFTVSCSSTMFVICEEHRE